MSPEVDEFSEEIENLHLHDGVNDSYNDEGNNSNDDGVKTSENEEVNAALALLEVKSFFLYAFWLMFCWPF